MARWKPQNSVGLNERIGRRLFDEPMLSGAVGQPSYSGLQVTHFEESRGSKVSLDRLGGTGIDRRVVNYLLPRAEAAGEKFAKAKSFDGWAAVAAKELTKARKESALVVYASPVSGLEPDDNIYHAHVLRPDNFSSHMMALHLRHIFTVYGQVEPNKNAAHSWVNRWRKASENWFYRLWARLTSH